MKLAAYSAWGYAVVLLGAGVWAFGWARGGWISLLSALSVALLLVLLGNLYVKGRASAGYLAGVTIFLMSLYFAYRFLTTETFVPSGVLLMVSFFFLFLLLLGFFIGLRDHLG